MEEGSGANFLFPLKHSGMSVHSERLLDHFKNPRHCGILPPPAVVIQVENPACGDVLKLSARLEDGHIVAAAFQVRGCTASISAGSALAEWLHGKDLDALRGFDDGVVDRALGGLPAASRHAAALCTSAVKVLLKRLAR
jgi:nitrogen fixation NifU-like protein